MTKYELYYQTAMFQFSKQLQRNRQLETKAGVSFGLGATMLGLAGLTVEHWSGWSIYPAILMLLGFLWTAFFGVGVLFKKPFEMAPDLSELSANLPDYETDSLQEWVADAFAESVSKNDEILLDKANWTQFALWSLLAEGLLLGIVVLSCGTF